MTTTWRFESVPIGGAPCYNMLKPQLDSWQEAAVLTWSVRETIILFPYPILEKPDKGQNVTCTNGSLAETADRGNKNAEGYRCQHAAAQSSNFTSVCLFQ